MTNAASSPSLADAIVECLRKADAEGLPHVAAHLDTALVALRGEGVWPDYASEEVWSPPRFDA